MIDIEQDLRSLGSKTREQLPLTVQPEPIFMRRVRRRRLLVGGGLSFAVVAAVTFGVLLQRSVFGSKALEVAGPKDAVHVQVRAQLLRGNFTDLDVSPKTGTICYDREALAEGFHLKRAEVFEEPSGDVIPLLLNRAYIERRAGLYCNENLPSDSLARLVVDPREHGLRLLLASGDESVVPLLPIVGERRILASGSVLSRPWEFYTYRSPEEVCLAMEVGDRGGSGGCGFGPLEGQLILDGAGGQGVDRDRVFFVFGRVGEGVDWLQLANGGKKKDVPLIELANDLGLGDRAFVLVLPSSKYVDDARLEAYSKQGQVVAAEELFGDPPGPPTVIVHPKSDAHEGLWPAATAAGIRRSCRTRTDIAHDSQEGVALDFTYFVLDWSEAETRLADADETGLPIEVINSNTNRSVGIFTEQLSDSCWYVSTVSGPSPYDTNAVEDIDVTNRKALIRFAPGAASSVRGELGFGSRTYPTKTWEAGARPTFSWSTRKAPRATGHFLLVFLDGDGQVLGAVGWLLPPGG